MIKNLLKPPVFSDSEITRKSTVFHKMVIYLTLVVISAQIINMIILPANLLRWMSVTVYFIAFGLILITMNKKGYQKQASLIFISTLFIILIILSYTSGGIDSKSMLNFPILILIVGLFHGWRASIVAGILSILAGLTLVVLGNQGLLPATKVVHNSFTVWVFVSMTILYAILIHYFSISSIDRALQRARDELKNRIKLEKNLRESEIFRKQVFESSRIPIVVMNTETLQFIDCNPAAVFIYGFKHKEELINKTPVDLSVEIQYDGIPSAVKARDYIQQSIKYGSAVFEWLHKRPDGKLWDAEVHLMRFEINSKTYLQFTLTDITEKKKTEKALKESELRLKSINDNFISGMLYQVIATPDGKRKFAYLSDSVKILYGINPEEGIADSDFIYNSIHPDDVDQFINAEEIAFKSLSTFKHEARIKNPAGEYRWSSFVSRPIKLEDNSVCWYGIEFIITDLKLAEEKLKESETRFKAIFENTQDAIGVAKGEINIFCNTAYLKLFGYNTVEEIQGKSLFENIAIHQQKKVADYVKKRSDNQYAPIYYESVGKRRNGEEFPFEINIGTYTLNGENYTVGIIRDITQRKAIEINLRESEAKYRFLFEQNPAPMLIYRLGSLCLLAVNEAFLNHYGYTQKEALSLKLTDLYPDEEKDSIKELAANLKGLVYAGQWHHLKKDGSIIQIEAHSHGFLFEGQESRIAVINDITQLKNAEKELIINEDRLQKLLRSVTDYIYSVKISNNIVTETIHGDGCIAVTGYSRQEFDNDPDLWHKIIYTEDKDYVIDQINSILKNKKIEPIEHRIIHKSNSVRWVRNTPVLTNGSDGEILGYDGLIENITERKFAEQKLIESETRYRNLFESANDAIFILNINSFKDCNKKATHLFGYTKQEMLNMQPWEVSPEFQNDGQLSKEKAIEKITNVMNGNPQRFEWQHLRADNTIFDAEVSLNRIDVPGEVVILGIVRDISERKKFEREIYLSTFKGEENERARLSKDLHDGLGPLISACKIYHHNINNLKFSKDETISYDKLGELLNESMYTIREISNNLSPHILRNFGLVDAIKNFADKLRTNTKINISSNQECYSRYDELIEVTLYRVLIELINNSLKYAHAKTIKIDIIDNNPKLLIHFQDNGIGFDFEEIYREPKGLGLINIHSRIRSIGGKISFISKKNKGVHVDMVISL